MLGLVIGFAILTAVVAWVVRERPAERVAPAPAGGPREMAESLVWKEGASSPNGRRVLWVQPAARAMLSMTKDPKVAAFFAAGCPVDTSALATRLPDDAVEMEVEWPLSEEEGAQALRGFRPEVMEDKWRVVAFPGEAGLRVFFFRSWTGALRYVVEVRGNAVRRLWAQKDDVLAEPMARALFDGYVRGKACVVPALAGFGEDKVALMLHGIQWAGRRCDAVEPNVDKGERPGGETAAEG